MLIKTIKKLLWKMENTQPTENVTKKIDRIFNIFLISIAIVVFGSLFLREYLSWFHILLLSTFIVLATIVITLKIIKIAETPYQQYKIGFEHQRRKSSKSKYLFALVGILLSWGLLVGILYVAKYGTLGLIEEIIFFIIIIALFKLAGKIIKLREKSGELPVGEAEKIEKIVYPVKSYIKFKIRLGIYFFVWFFIFISTLMGIFYLMDFLNLWTKYMYIGMGFGCILSGLLTPLVLNVIYYRKLIPENIENLSLLDKLFSFTSFLTLLGFIGFCLISFSILPRNTVFKDLLPLIFAVLCAFSYHKLIYRISSKLSNDLKV